DPPLLPEAAVDIDDSFGGAVGFARRRAAEAGEELRGIRYYDVSRDYQAGLQRPEGRAVPGAHRVLEFPGALDAATARQLVQAAGERDRGSRDKLAWRVSE